jgi:hypothetical protein
MKRTVFVGALVGALAASTAFAQSSGKGKGGQTANEGHTAPKQQPLTEPAPAGPDGSMALGTVHIPRAVKANGQPLAAGTYQVRLTPDTASPVAKGATASLERWVEFVKGGKVAGREVMTIVPPTDVPKIQKDAPPRPGSSTVQALKGGDYLRLWINRGGTYYLLYFAV